MRRAFSFLLILLLTNPVSAAEFSVETWRGRTVLRMTGVIEMNDAHKFIAAYPQADSFPHGYPIVLLESPGGNLGEALRISKAFDSFPVHAIVPDGARCASACASVVLIGAQLRTVEPQGALGQHACLKNGKPFPECMEILGQHALEHGVSYGSIAAFVSDQVGADLIWFSRQDADGWGLTRYAGTNEVGFEKSEPRAIIGMTGQVPPAQPLWRLELRGTGYEAFARVDRDDEREFEMNLFCDERRPGQMFLSLEIHGPANVIKSAIRSVAVSTDRWRESSTPFEVVQADQDVSEIIASLPVERTGDLLTRSNTLRIDIATNQPYQPMFAASLIGKSRKSLLFAANHCMNG